jgi:hypothetical protein
MKDKIVDIREIKLPKGSILHVELTDDFLKKIREQYNLLSQDKVSDDHVRAFLWGVINDAVVKEERKT